MSPDSTKPVTVFENARFRIYVSENENGSHTLDFRYERYDDAWLSLFVVHEMFLKQFLDVWNAAAKSLDKST
jgi:hypothetical protein